MMRRVLASPQIGLVLVILLLGTVLTLSAGSHVDARSGLTINNFLNTYTLIQTATDASFFAIMAVGATLVIISGGIDLSVGSIYALAGVTTAMVLRAMGPLDPVATVALAAAVALGVGLVSGLLNGALVVGLNVHPFIITLGTMWILRGIAFVTSHAESILLPASLTSVAKASLGLNAALYPVPMLAMIVVAGVGAVYLTKTVMGRHIFAVGGNQEASRFAGLQHPSHQDRRLRHLRPDGRHRRVHGRELLRIGLVRATRQATSCTSSPRRWSAARASRAARAARSARCSAPCSSSSSASRSARCTSTRTTSGSSSAARSSSLSSSIRRAPGWPPSGCGPARGRVRQPVPGSSSHFHQHIRRSPSHDHVRSLRRDRRVAAACRRVRFIVHASAGRQRRSQA